MNATLKAYTSRKFVITVLFSLIVVLNQVMQWNIPEDTLKLIATMIGGWIGVEGLADIVSRTKVDNQE